MALLGWALLFLIFAIICAIFGFAVLAAASAWIAKGLFILFIILFIITLAVGAIRRV